MTNGLASELNQWRGHTRVFLQPIAAPSILGLFGFAAATVITTAYLVGWYGTTTSRAADLPFAMAAGGLAQGAAALWAYRARDRLPRPSTHLGVVLDPPTRSCRS